MLIRRFRLRTPTLTGILFVFLTRLVLRILIPCLIMELVDNVIEAFEAELLLDLRSTSSSRQANRLSQIGMEDSMDGTKQENTRTTRSSIPSTLSAMITTPSSPFLE